MYMIGHLQITCFSMPKSFISFSPNKYSSLSNVYINPEYNIISPSSNVLDLGVYMSSNCTFDFHVANVYKRCCNLTGWILTEHLTLEILPKPLSPSAPLLTSLVAPTPSIIHPTQTSVATPQPPSLKNQIASSSPANKPACKFYMQGRCKNGRKGTNCSFPHPNMCLRFI